MSAAAIACSRGAAALGFRCRSLMRLPAAQVGCPRSNLSLLQRFSSQFVKSNGSQEVGEGRGPVEVSGGHHINHHGCLNESLKSVAQSFVSKPEMQSDTLQALVQKLRDGLHLLREWK